MYIQLHVVLHFNAYCISAYVYNNIIYIYSLSFDVKYRMQLRLQVVSYVNTVIYLIEITCLF